MHSIARLCMESGFGGVVMKKNEGKVGADMCKRAASASRSANVGTFAGPSGLLNRCSSS